MFQIGDYLIFKKNVCKVVDKKEKYLKDKDYYVLSSVNDETLTTLVPVDSPFIKNLLTKKEVEALIKKIPSIPLIESKTRLIENEYKELLARGDYEDLIKVIKTTYLRNKERLEQHKRAGDKDNYYFNLAESYLYTEFAIVLDKTVDEVRDYLIEQINAFEGV